MPALLQLAPLRLVGDDSRLFLQGQLSQDLLGLTPHTMQLASCNSAQGRVQAIVRIIERSDGLWLLLPSSVVEVILPRLRKYVLRAKTRIEDIRTEWNVYSASATELQTLQLPVPKELGSHVQLGAISVIRWPDPLIERYLVLQPTTADGSNATLQQNSADHDWLLADIRAGLPQVLAETHESFVAQMLNLDLLNGISFTKGCYTGQEIIARAHYRGTVKRRMYRLSASCPAPAPGTRILVQDNHAGEVVMSAATDTGCELLAVLNVAQRNESLHLDNADKTAVTLLTLPYAVDEP